MKRRSLDAVDLLARLFDVARAEEEDEEAEALDGPDGLPRQPPPPGDPRLGTRILARIIADQARGGETPEALSARAVAETGASAPRRRRKEPIRAFGAAGQGRARAG